MTVIQLKKNSFFSLDREKMRTAKLKLKALDHRLRQRMFDVIQEAGDRGLSVTDIYIKLRLEQSVASQHLAILRRAYLVSTQRQGKFIIYTVDEEGYRKICAFVNGICQ